MDGQLLSVLIEKGGPIVVILLGMSLIGFTIILVKALQFLGQRLRNRKFVDPVLTRFSQGDAVKTLEVLRVERNPIAQVMATAIEGFENPSMRENDVREDVTRVGNQAIASLESHFRSLETIASLSPLLGLLGTVVGMIQAFSRISEAGSRVDPSILSGGIWAALLTTAVGLAVAIPISAALSVLESEVDRVRNDMGDLVTRLFTLRSQSNAGSNPI